MRVPKPETTQAEEGESTPTHQAETVPPEEAGSSLKNQTQRMCALLNTLMIKKKKRKKK